MVTDPTSLDRLHDIVVPAPVPWWPPAPGWLWLMGFAGVVVLAVLLRLFIRRQRNRYRREALAEVGRLVARLQRGEPPADIAGGLAVVLKRTAITAYSRARVAALTGGAWYVFLDRSAGTRFSDGLGATMERAVYGGAGAEDASIRDFAVEIRNWIRNHAPAGAGESARVDVDAPLETPRPGAAKTA